MSRHRSIVRPLAVLAAMALAKGCGDSAPTAPPPPEPARPTTVTVSPATVELTALGTTVQLTAEVRDQNARLMPSATVTWSSSAAAVATVDASGLVTGVGEGEATITASAGSASGSVVVTVMQPVATVEVTPPADTIGLGSTLELTAKGFDENGDALEGVEFLWESSDTAIATVDVSGAVTGVAVGAATITASAGSGSGHAKITVADLERAALVAFYEATDGPNWVNNENWLTDTPLGEWYGVDTSAVGRVIRLNLAGTSDGQGGGPHGLSGTIPPELGNLASLRSLDLGYNLLSGPIPTELGSLADLEVLNLRGNDLTGPIPSELGELGSLTWLGLYSNSLTGPIPTELGRLASLESLYLSRNDLTGPIPSELGELSSLTRLSLASNSLTGPIPTELGRLTDLESLSLGGNELSGPIPTVLGSLADLELLYLWGNNLTGPIPESFLALDVLAQFRFERNVDLCVPGTIDFVTWLERIETVSGPYCNESDAQVLGVLYQTSGGPNWTNSSGWLETPALDEWYGITANSLGQVVGLNLTRNGLMGELTANLGSLAAMTTLRVGSNALSGQLPLSLANLSLVEFDYADTNLCVPAEVSFRTWLNGIPSHNGTGAECAPPPSYPIHVSFTFDISDRLRREVERAAEEWGRVLHPTLSAPFTFTQAFQVDVEPWMTGFESGQVLDAGLHVFVTDQLTSDRASGQFWAVDVRGYGTSDVAMNPVGFIGLNIPYLSERQGQVAYVVALHEIAHALGIGRSGDRWNASIRERTTDGHVYLANPDVIAVFDRLGGHAFPVETPKVPVDRDKSHWNLCSGSRDIMSRGVVLAKRQLTELTAASLDYGYVYDRQLVAYQPLDASAWNTDSYACQAGRRTAAMAPSESAVFDDLVDDIVYLP